MIARIALCMLLCIASTCWALKCSGDGTQVSGGCQWQGNYTIPAGRTHNFFVNCFTKDTSIQWYYDVAGGELLIKYGLNCGFTDCGSWTWNDNTEFDYAGEGWQSESLEFQGIGSPSLQIACNNWVDDCHIQAILGVDID